MAHRLSTKTKDVLAGKPISPQLLQKFHLPLQEFATKTWKRNKVDKPHLSTGKENLGRWKGFINPALGLPETTDS